MNEKTLIYIAGEGRSGSTLLDIILGSHKEAFSTGELVNLPQKGIINKEYCSCGKPVPECDLWVNIIEEWDRKRSLDIKKYIQIQQEFLSLKSVISSYKRLKNPTKEISSYLEDTFQLYETIFKETNSNILIDSSKSPTKIPILKKMGYNLVVIHLTRRFGDVLNSYKKSAKKDLKAGIEHDTKPEKTFYVLKSWMIKNLLTAVYSKNTTYKKIRYEEIVENPSKYISNFMNFNSEYSHKLEQRGPFTPTHLVAGNRIRMKEQIYIAEKPMNSSYHRLNQTEKLLSRAIDIFY